MAIRIADPDDDGQLLVEVEDDGRGFDPGETGSGFGLLGMRERVALVQGELEVTSRPGDGTTAHGDDPGPAPCRATMSPCGSVS